MFEEEYSLPCSQKHASGGDRDGLRSSSQGHAEVTGHVIRSFDGVLKPRRVFGNKPLEKLMKVPAGRRVGVFHDHEAATGVAHEHGDNPLRDPAGSEDIAHPARDLDRALTMGLNRNSFVLDMEGLHDGTCDPGSWMTSSILSLQSKGIFGDLVRPFVIERDPVRGHARVTGHVIGPLNGVLKPRGVFGDKPVEKLMQVTPGGGIGVFHDDEAATGVEDKNRQTPLRDAAGLQDMAHRFSKLDGSLAAGFYFDGLVPDKERFHDGISGPEPK